MNDHLTEEQVITYIEEGRSDAIIQEHLIACEPCRKKVEEFREVIELTENMTGAIPPKRIAWEFSAALEEEKRKLDRKNTLFPYWQIAAAIALLVSGFAAGKLSEPDQSDELIALRSQVDLLKEMSMVNALQTHTASERIQTVNWIEEEKTIASERLIKTLVNTLNTDESPNVRYAAAQALNRYIDQENVRLALASSLERQTDALIQIALISMLVEAGEKTAIQPIKKIIEEGANSPEVKKQAKVALDILS